MMSGSAARVYCRPLVGSGPLAPFRPEAYSTQGRFSCLYFFSFLKPYSFFRWFLEGCIIQGAVCPYFLRPPSLLPLGVFQINRGPFKTGLGLTPSTAKLFRSEEKSRVCEKRVEVEGWVGGRSEIQWPAVSS